MKYTLFCEWCLGNAQWFSHHKQVSQKLFIRFHRQEIDPKLPFLAQIHWEAVDRIIFISPKIRTFFLEQFPHLASKSEVIYNLIDTAAFRQPEDANSALHLGLLGMVPKLKAPHLAVEILEALHAQDDRFRLFIKGKEAKAYPWMKKKIAEGSYYEAFYQDLAKNPISTAISFDPFDKEVAAWFGKIGFILSTSEVEGSHQAVAEGMASGAIPIIRNWPGAEEIYPARYLFETVEQAVALIQKFRQPERYRQEATFAQDFARKHFDKAHIFPLYDQLFAGRRDV